MTELGCQAWQVKFTSHVPRRMKYISFAMSLAWMMISPGVNNTGLNLTQRSRMNASPTPRKSGVCEGDNGSRCGTEMTKRRNDSAEIGCLRVQYERFQISRRKTRFHYHTTATLFLLQCGFNFFFFSYTYFSQ